MVAEGLSDDDLLSAHLKGDPQALATLLKRYEKWHYSIACKRIFDDPELARDGVQEAWLTIYRKAHTFRGESKLSTWMYQIVDRTCIDLLRKIQARPKLAELDVEIIDATQEQSEFTEESVTRLRVYEALQSIAADQREALVKVVMEGYSVEDAARELNIPVGTVKSRCARGRAALAEILADYAPMGREPEGASPRLTRYGGEG